MEGQHCLCPSQGVRVSETPEGVSGLDPSRGESINVEPGCSLPDPCDSNPCPANSYCSDDWDSYSCSCDPGVPGARGNEQVGTSWGLTSALLCGPRPIT